MKRVLIIIITCALHKSCGGIIKDLGEVLNDTNSIDLLLDDLGVKMEPLIFGGRETNMARYPSAVLFLNQMNICGGVILSSKVVITAAHCLKAGNNLQNMRVYANSRYIFDKAADIHYLWDYVVHEHYGTPTKFSNNVALLIIVDTFNYKPSVQPAVLVINEEWMNESASEDFKVTGWGMINTKGDFSRAVQYADLHFLPRPKCETISENVLSSDMFCLSGGGDKGPCIGDSGGGVMWRGKLVGLVSHGNACGEDPGVYSNVFHHRMWIDRTVHRLYNKFCSYKNRIAADYS